MKNTNNKILNRFSLWIYPDQTRIISHAAYANYIIVLIGFFALFSILFNMFLGLGESFYISSALFVASIFFFFLNRFSQHFKWVISAGYISLIMIYNLYYIYNYGLSGPMNYFSFLIVYVTLLYSQSRFKTASFSIFILNILVLYYLDLNFEGFSNHYKSFSDQFIDHLVSILIVISSFVLLVRNLINIQIKEKKIAQESSHLKSAFLANTSHDLRAPANSILSFSELINQEDLSPNELQKYIKVIHSNSEQLLNLINDIFDISIIESKNLVIKPQNTNINDQLEELYSNFKRLIEISNKNIDLKVHFGLPMTQSIIYADPVRIKQVLTNLLQNAVKHTEMGAIIFGYDKKMNSDELHFFVKDSGHGIPEDKQKDIFNRYVTNVEQNKKASGIGLGLHITASLVKQMNGEIGLSSKEGVGSHFYFTIPFEAESRRAKSKI
jgi:signal transduction histidine kinase